MILTYVFAWLLPFVAGCLACMAFDYRRRPGWAAAVAGYGFVLGLLLVSLSAALAARANTASALTGAAPCLVAIALAAAGVWWWRARSSGSEGTTGRRSEYSQAASVLPTSRPSRWQWIVLFVLLASLVYRAALAAREIWLRPTYPWDAWSAWMVKAKTWFLLGHYVPYGSLHDWMLQSPGSTLYTGVAQHYPNALAWFEIWFASAAGGWIEPLINLPWLGVWAALLLAHYGQWRLLGLDRVRSLLFIYLLGSLPLLIVHAALAGYADIFIAALFGFSVLAWMRWLQRRDRSQLMLALVCAAALPTIKLEGWIWMTSIVGAIAFGMLPTRWRWRCAAAAVVVFLVLFVFGGAKALVALAGSNSISGQMALVLSPSLHTDAVAGIGRTLFAQPNWHLLWWAALPIVAWRWRELTLREWLWQPGLLLAVCIGLLAYLFLFTAASVWARDYTAINRLLLQLAPATMSFLALLLRDASPFTAVSDTEPASGLHKQPA